MKIPIIFYFKQTFVYPEPINLFAPWDKRLSELWVTLWSFKNWAKEKDTPFPLFLITKDDMRKTHLGQEIFIWASFPFYNTFLLSSIQQIGNEKFRNNLKMYWSNSMVDSLASTETDCHTVSPGFANRMITIHYGCHVNYKFSGIKP